MLTFRLAHLSVLIGILARATVVLAQPAQTLEQMPAGAYKSDNQHTHIYFTYNHVGFSSAHGRFDKFDGHLNFLPTNIEASPVVFTIDAGSIDMNVPELESLLKGVKFFDTGKFPEVKFVSRHLGRTSANRGVLQGNLTMHGITRPVTLDVTLNKFLADSEPKFSRFGFTASGTIKRSEWGLGGVPLVGDEVTLTLDVEFTKTV